MKRSRLKCKASMTKNPIDIKNYMKERNVAVKLNRQSKSEYFEKVVNDLDVNKFSSCPMENIFNEIDSLMSKSKYHPSILKIKQILT